MTLEEGVARLLEQCDREERNTSPDRRFLYVSEIRHLLGVGPSPADYSGLATRIKAELESPGLNRRDESPGDTQ